MDPTRWPDALFSRPPVQLGPPITMRRAPIESRPDSRMIHSGAAHSLTGFFPRSDAAR